MSKEYPSPATPMLSRVARESHSDMSISANDCLPFLGTPGEDELHFSSFTTAFSAPLSCNSGELKQEID